MRAGPGLGNIAPEQGDYNQIVKGGGHGNYHTLVVAPDSVQEMADLTTWAFDLADEYRNPVVVLADGYIGQMMEPVAFAPPRPLPAAPDWSVTGTAATRKNLISSIYLEPDAMERHVRKLEAKYQRAEREIARCECWRTEDAEIVLVGYGIVGRVLKAVVEEARAHGMAVGLLRPITLYPFPDRSCAHRQPPRESLRRGRNEHGPVARRRAAGARRALPGGNSTAGSAATSHPPKRYGALSSTVSQAACAPRRF